VKITIPRISEKLGLDRDTAYAFMNYLRGKKLAVEAGREPLPEGRKKGVGAMIFEVDLNTVLNEIQKDLEKLGSA
jgi:hypothetical protein